MHLLLSSVQVHNSENETSWNKILHTSFSLPFHNYFLVQRRMTQDTPKASAFNYYIFQRLTGVVAIAGIYIVCLPLKLSNTSVVEFPSAFETLRAHVPTICNNPCDGARLNF